MSKGLALILEKIKASPSQTLVSRYLALISELTDDADKSERALDLASVLVRAKPADAMRIAHMVFRSDPANLRALDVLVDCLVARGRYAKAEVLRIERAKRAAAIAEGKALAEATDLNSLSLANAAAPEPAAAEVGAGPTLRLGEMSPLEHPAGAGIRQPGAREAPLYAAGDGQVEPPYGQPAVRETPLYAAGDGRVEPPYGQPAVREAPLPGQPVARSPHDLAGGAVRPSPDLSRIAELDLEVEDPTAARGALDRLFPKDAAAVHPPEIYRGEIGRTAQLLADVSRSTPPGDTVLPIGRGYRLAAPGDGDAPTVAMSGFGAVLELFDYYWRQGFVGEARELLKQTSLIAGHEPWWQARNALLEKSKLSAVQPPAGAAAESSDSLAAALAKAARSGPVPPAPNGQAKPLPADDFWRPLQSEIARLARSSRPLLVPPARVERLKDLLAASAVGRRLPVELVRTLAELDHRVPGADASKLLELKWDLLQGLWAGAPDGACAALLEELQLTRATPGFWGLYLDALVAGGGARKALVEIRRGLTAKPHLIWARTAWQRLALVWMQLQVYGFPWSEDEGVPSLMSRLAERPRPKAAGLVAMAAARTKQTAI